MTKDKLTDALLAALKQALAEPGEHRLYKSGKLAGLFPSRSGTAGDAAAQALRAGLLEPARSEIKGKTTIEWVRLTPRGVDFVHEHESPVRVLQELQAVLQTTRHGVPVWLEQTRQELTALGQRLTAEVERVLQRLDALGRQVEQALQRVEETAARVPEDLTDGVPWAADALTYLERRQAGGAPGPCPLPELYGALREQHGELELSSFHDGLRCLRDGRALRLLPVNGAADDLAEPEFAFLDGADLLYYAVR
jgi:hypothetical protein